MFFLTNDSVERNSRFFEHDFIKLLSLHGNALFGHNNVYLRL